MRWNKKMKMKNRRTNISHTYSVGFHIIKNTHTQNKTTMTKKHKKKSSSSIKSFNGLIRGEMRCRAEGRAAKNEYKK